MNIQPTDQAHLIRTLEAEFDRMKSNPRIWIEKDRLLVCLSGYQLWAHLDDVAIHDPEGVVIKFLEQYHHIKQYPKPGGMVKKRK